MSLDAVLFALSDPTRRLIFERLRVQSSPVVELAEGLDVSRPAVSQHLKVLKEGGLVTEYAEGTRRIYSIDTRGLRLLRAYLDGLWDDALRSFAAHVKNKQLTHEPSPEPKKTPRKSLPKTSPKRSR